MTLTSFFDRIMELLLVFVVVSWNPFSSTVDESPPLWWWWCNDFTGDVRSDTPLTRGAFVIVVVVPLVNPPAAAAPEELDRLAALLVEGVIDVVVVDDWRWFLGELLRLAVLVLPVRPLFRVIALSRWVPRTVLSPVVEREMLIQKSYRY